MGTRAHSPTSSASTAPVERFALGPAGRPTGDRAPPLALDHNEGPGNSPSPGTTGNDYSDLEGLTGPDCTDKQQLLLVRVDGQVPALGGSPPRSCPG